MTVATICPFCGVGCGMMLSIADDGAAEVRPQREHPVSRGQLCLKGWNATQFLRNRSRITAPLLRRGSRLQPVSWHEALNAAAVALNKARAHGGPDAVGVISSARATNEDNFAAMKFARAVLGTNNIDHCARVCHAPSVAGLQRTLGSGAMTNSIRDIEGADCVLVWGADTTESHPIIGSRILEAKQRGARLIVVDPRRTRLARVADLHLQLRLGADIPLANAMVHVILEHGWEDARYLAERCQNLAALRESVDAFAPDQAAIRTGVPAADILRAAQWYAGTKHASLIYGLGVTQHICGTENVIALSNLALVTGHVGIEGAGINPLRGQNNVQGACDMGALPNVYSGYQNVHDAAARAKFARAWGVELPEQSGLTTLAMQQAAHDGAIRCMLILGQDPVVTDPVQAHVTRALASLDCLIVADMFVTDTAQCADIVLPAASWAEKDGTFTSMERRVQRVRQAVPPPGLARSDWNMLEALAQQLGRTMGFRSAEQIFAEITRLTPLYGGMTYARLDGDGLQWPCKDASGPGTPVLHREGFAGGKALLIPVTDTLPAESPDDAFPLQLTTFRLQQQYGSGSMTRRAPLLERENPRGLLWMHSADAAAYGIDEGCEVTVRSRRGEVKTRSHISDDVPRGVVAMPYHFSEAPPNRVTNDAADPLSRMPELKVCTVAVERCR